MTTVKYNKKQFQDVLNKLDKFGGKQAKTIFKNAFNRAGFSVRKKIVEEDMDKIFNHPNAYTKNSLVFRPVQVSDSGDINKGILEFKKKFGGGVGAGIYLMPNEWGGSRMFKGFELRLQRMNLIPDGMFAVPTRNLPRDKRNPASLQKLATDLGKGVTRVASGKATRNKGFDLYFAVKVKSGRLEPGIYARVGRRGVVRLFAYVDKVTYKQIFHFYEKARTYFAEFFVDKINDEMNKVRNG